MKVQTAKILINLFNAASKDETRRHLMGVNVEKLEEHYFQLTATDGYILSTAKVYDDLIGIADGCDKDTWILSYEALPVLKHYVKEYKNEMGVYSTWKDDKVHLGESCILPIIEREFPRYKNVIPNQKGKVSIAFNVDYLHKLTKTMGKRRINTIAMHFDVTKRQANLKPMIIEPLGCFSDKEKPYQEAVEKMILMPVKF